MVSGLRVAATSAVLGLIATTAYAAAPAAWQGSWSGQQIQAFALANPTVPDSYECLPNQATISRGVNVNVDATTFVRSAMNATTAPIPGSYSLPHTDETDYDFTGYNTNNGQLLLTNKASGYLECSLAKVSADGKSVTIVVLGGLANNATVQCNTDSYSMFPDVFNTPYCATPGAGQKSAYNSTTIYTLTMNDNNNNNNGGGGGNGGGVGSGSMATTVSGFAAAFLTTALGAALFL